MRGGRERSGVLSKAKTGFDEESLDQILQEYYMTIYIYNIYEEFRCKSL